MLSLRSRIDVLHTERVDSVASRRGELRPGLWHWEAPHPEWQPSERWNQMVSSYAVDDGDRPPVRPDRSADEIHALAAERETAVVLTAPWHERDTQSLVERLGVPVFTCGVPKFGPRSAKPQISRRN